MTYTPTVTITAGDGATAAATSTVTVGDVYANVAQGLSFGAFSSNSLTGTPSTYTATIDWGDDTTDTTGMGTVQVTGPQGGFRVAGTHTYAATGLYTVQITVVDAAGNTTVAYDAIQAVMAPATGYDGEVATTVGAASGATEGVAADPGGQGGSGGLADAPETQTPSSPGQSTFNNLIRSAAGLLVTAAMANVEAAPAAPYKIVGPAVVPGNSIYSYTMTIPMTPANKFDPDVGALEALT